MISCYILLVRNTHKKSIWKTKSRALSNEKRRGRRSVRFLLCCRSRYISTHMSVGAECAHRFIARTNRTKTPSNSTSPTRKRNEKTSENKKTETNDEKKTKYTVNNVVDTLESLVPFFCFGSVVFVVGRIKIVFVSGQSLYVHTRELM